MNRKARVVVVLACTFAALVGSTARVPTRWFTRRFVSDTKVVRPSESEPGVTQRIERWTPWEPSADFTAMHRWAWVWDMKALPYPAEGGAPWAMQRLDWRILAPTQVVILIVGGGLLTWAARREWRRHSAVAP